MLRFLTAGESHGPFIVVILEGMPAGVPITVEEISGELARRRLGYGRGPRMRFEEDKNSVVAETIVALVLASEALRKFGGDSLAEVIRDRDGFLSHLEETPSSASQDFVGVAGELVATTS